MIRQRPSFYTHHFLLFSPCGTMFPHISLLQVTRMDHRRRQRSLSIDRVDSSPCDLHQDRCVKKNIIEALDGRHVAGRGGINLHRTIAISELNAGRHVESSELEMEIGWRQLLSAHDRGSRSRLDSGPIAARLWPDHCAIVAKLPCNLGHD